MGKLQNYLSEDNKNLNLVLAALIALLATYTCGRELTYHSFQSDELAVMWHQTFTFSRLIDYSTNWAYLPPLFIMILKGWVSCFGSDEFSARSLSVTLFVAICLVPYAYRRIIPFPWWLLSLVLISSYPLILVSRMVITYSLASLLSFITWMQLRKWKSQINKFQSGLLLIFVTLCFYTHYLAWGFTVLICGMTFCEYLFRRDFQKAKALLRIGGLHLLLILPWYLQSQSLRQMVEGTNLFWNAKTDVFLELRYVYLYLFSESYTTMSLWAVVVLIGLLFVLQARVETVLLVLAMLIYTSYIFYRSTGTYSYFGPRYFVWFVPVLYYLYIINVPKKLRYIVTFIFLGFNLTLLQPVYFQDWDDIQSPFSYSMMQGGGRKCEMPVSLFWYNTQWYKPYIKRFSRCTVIERNETICNENLDTLLRSLPRKGLVIYHQSFCKELFEPLFLLNPEDSGMIHFKQLRLLILGQTREEFLKEIFSAPGINWP